VANAKYAYYPYDEDMTRIGIDGNLKVTLAGGEQTYTGASIKIPMFGTVDDSQKVTFTPLTALLKVTVLNMPSTASKAVLSSVGGDNGAEPLYGAATISSATTDATRALALNPTGNDENVNIAYTFEATDINKEEMVFYYIIPAGAYTDLVFSLDDTYTKDPDKLEDLEEANQVFAAAMSNVNAGTVWTKTIRFTEDGNIEEDAVTKINDELAGISSSTTSNSTTTLAGITSNPTIIIPTVASKDDEAYISASNEITVTLTDVPTLEIGEAKTKTPCTITIKKDKADGFAPAKIKIVASKASGESNLEPNFVIDLEGSTVTLDPAGTSRTTYAEVSSKATTLNVGQYATITDLTIGSGNVSLVKVSSNNGVVTNAALADGNNKAYIFYDDTETQAPTITKATGDEDKIFIQPESINKLLSGKGDAKLGTAFTLTDVVTVEGTLTLDLNGKTLTIGEGGSITVAKGGTLTVDDSQNSVQGAITTILAGATINVEDGKLVLGTTTNDHKAVALKNEATSTAVALNVTGGEVELTNTAVTGDINVAGGKLTDTSTEAGKVSVTGDLSISDQGSATLAYGAVTGKATVSGNETALTLTGGTLAVEAESGETAVTISGGASVSVTAATVTGEEYAFDVQEGTLTVSGAATITGTTAAVNVTKGELTVSGGATLSGETTIITVPAVAEDAVITLSGKATYNATAKKNPYVLYNHNAASNAPAAAIEITDGTFNGDVISDNAKWFIKGGKFSADCTNLYTNKDTYIHFLYEQGKTDGGYMTIKGQGETQE
jgi:hypothetical protein